MSEQNTHFIAIGADWCGYSKKQEEVVNALGDKSENVHMLMCQGKDESLDAPWKKKACEQAMGQISGFPTWFKKEGALEDESAPVVPITKQVTQQQGLHFMQETQLCDALPGACKK